MYSDLVDRWTIGLETTDESTDGNATRCRSSSFSRVCSLVTTGKPNGILKAYGYWTLSCISFVPILLVWCLAASASCCMLICWPYLLHIAAACQTPWACWRGPCLLPSLLHGGRSLMECSRLYMHCTAPIQSLTKSHHHLAHTTDLRAAALQRRQATLWTLIHSCAHFMSKGCSLAAICS